MIIIKCYSGGTRFVIVVGFLAFKFAKINPITAYKFARKHFVHNHLKDVTRKYGYTTPVSPLYWLFRGIMANWLEWRYYRRSRLPILVPTYLSLGLVNIQLAGVRPQMTEKYFRNQISAIIGHDENSDHDIHADSHTLRILDNYAAFAGRLKIVDYGSKAAWPFLDKWGQKIFDCFVIPLTK